MSLENLIVPPHSTEAEQSLLGALLLDNQAFEQVSFLQEQSFYGDGHRRLWRTLARMIEAGKGADLVTVCTELGDDLLKAGGPAYIAALAQNVPAAINIRRYADLVYEKSIRRQLAQIATEIAQDALSAGSRDVGQMLDEAEGRILRIAEATSRNGEGPVDIKPLLSKVYERIDHLYHRDDPSGITGVPTGYTEIDQKTSGLQPGDLVIIAGRPSMGKTALALNIAEHVAVKKALPVVVFSMEMSASQLATRVLGSIARVDHHKMRTGKLNDEEWSALTEAMGKLHEAPISIDETGAMTALEVRARARRQWRRYGKLGLIVIDYIQLMEASTKGEHRAGEVAEISRSLKAMAKELDCPVVALSQLNRAVDSRPDKRPNMSDLRESGAIEQDADVILFIYREAVYNHDLSPEEAAIAEVIIGKQRNGPIGLVPLTFLGRYTRFENYVGPDGSTWAPRRVQKSAKPVASFADFKSKAAGDA